MISVNTNTTATISAFNLQESNHMLNKSLQRLSSGKRIVSPYDDAGGLAVSTKLTAQHNRQSAVDKNISNGISFLQVQDGAYKTAANILDRISELRTLYDDVTKNSSDKANYDTEYQQLRQQLGNITAEKFNGISLFNATAGGSELSVYTNEQSSSATDVKVSLSKAALKTAVTTAGNVDLSDSTSGTTDTLADISIGQMATVIENVATLRATNGAQATRLMHAQSLLHSNMANIEQANSRIIDTDVASESTAFAKYNILVQSGASMLAQANSLSNVALALLQ